MTQRKATQPTTSRSWIIRIAALLAFLVEVIFIQGAFSPFRTPKMLLALSGLAVLSSTALFLGLARGHLRIPWGKLGAVLIALPLFQALSAAWAPSPTISLQRAWTTALWIIGAFALSTATEEDRRYILRWTILGAGLSGIVLLAQVAGIEAFRLAAYEPGNRLGLAGLAGNPADFALGAMLLLPFLARDLFRKSRNYLLWLQAAILLCAALLSQNLTALLAALCLGAWYIYRKPTRRVLIVSGFLILLGTTALVFSPLGGRIQHEVKHLENGNWYDVLSARGDGWSAAEQMIQKAQLSGIGAGQFSREFYPARLAFLKEHHQTGGRKEMATHFEWAHNDILEMVAELGLMGAIWALVFIWALFRAVKKPQILLLPFGIVVLPFLIFHYPTHIAVGLLPILLFVAEVLHDAPTLEWQPRRPLPAVLASLVLVGASIFFLVSNFERLSLERWRGAAEAALTHLDEMPKSEGHTISIALEKQTAIQMLKHPRERDWLWRIVGRTRLARGAAGEAEHAFRKAFSLFPHEEAEMGLGLALASQNRITEALYHLGRVCRLNPTLLRLIPDPELRAAVREEFRNKPEGKGMRRHRLLGSKNNHQKETPEGGPRS